MKTPIESTEPSQQHDAKSDRLQRFEKRAEWPLAIAAMMFLVAYSVQVLAQPTGLWQGATHLTLILTYAAFVIDYFTRLYLAPNRGRWFVRHLPELAIVALPLLRPLRLMRLVVLVLALQKAIGGAIRGRITVFTAASTVLIIYAGSLAILQAERSHPEASIKSFGSALWWSFTTVAAFGYNDAPPVTGVGRLFAVALMIAGISLVGIVTATVTSFIFDRVAAESSAPQVSPDADLPSNATDSHVNMLREDLKQHIDGLHAEIAQLKACSHGLSCGRTRRSHFWPNERAVLVTSLVSSMGLGLIALRASQTRR